MIPHERSLVEKLAGKPFAIVGVNSDADKEYYRSQQKELPVTWRSFWCGEKGTWGPIPTRWNVSSWPTIFVLDHKGVIRFKNVRGEKMEEAVTQLLDEMQQEQGQPK